MNLFYCLLLQKNNEGKAHSIALSRVSKKLVRVIYKLETSDIPFDSSKIKVVNYSDYLLYIAIYMLKKYVLKIYLSCSNFLKKSF